MRGAQRGLMRLQQLTVQFALLLLTAATLSFAYYAVFDQSERLSREAQERRQEIEQMRAKTLHVKNQTYMLERELELLSVDSELSSFVARTILGVVRPTEMVYQLNAPSLDELPEEEP
jgi:cell division protein FtsB